MTDSWPDASQLGNRHRQTRPLARCRRWAAIVMGILAWTSHGLAAAPAETAPQSGSATVPAPLDAYMGRVIAPTMHFTGAAWLLRTEREQEEHCQEMLQNLGVKPGMTVCDMGCGNGFYALQLATLVGPQGTVWAVDVQPEMLRLLQARAAEAEINNIKTVLGELHDPHLMPNTLDMILCVDVYHEFSHPVPMLAAMRQALKPTGLLVLVEFREEDPRVPIKPLHKMSRQQVLKELGGNQFELDHEYTQLPWQHMMFFRRVAP